MKFLLLQKQKQKIYFQKYYITTLALKMIEKKINRFNLNFSIKIERYNF